MKFRLFVKYAGWVFTIQPLFPLLMYIKSPLSHRYISIRFKSLNLQNATELHVIGGLIDLIFSYVTVFPALWVVLSAILYYQKMNYWLTETTKIIQACGQPFNAIKKYRTMQTINQLVYEHFTPMVLPTIYGTGYWASVGLWTGILKGHRIMPNEVIGNLGPMAMLGLIVINLNVDAAGVILQCSQHLKRNLVSRRSSLLNRYVKSSRDIKIYVGSTFFYERSTFAVTVNTMLNNVLTITLTF